MSIHVNYAALPPHLVKVVDDAFEAVADQFRDSDLRFATDDRAEVLVEAIATFLMESNQDIKDEVMA